MTLLSTQQKFQRRGWGLLAKASDGSLFPIFTRSVSDDVLHEGKWSKLRKPWVGLTRTPEGRWQILRGGPAYKHLGGVFCEGSSNLVSDVFPQFVQLAASVGLRKFDTFSGIDHWMRHVYTHNAPPVEEPLPRPDLFPGPI